MNRTKKTILCVLTFVLVTVSMFPISAFAFEPIMFHFSKPYVSSTTGYICVKDEWQSYDNGYVIFYQITPLENNTASYMGDTPLLVLEDISSNKLYFHLNGDHYTLYSFSYCILSTVGDVVYYDYYEFANNSESDYFYLPLSFSITHIDVHGNIDRSGIDDYPTFEYLFAEDKYEYSIFLALVNVLNEYGSLSDEERELLQDIVDSNDNITSTLSQLRTEFALKLQRIIEDNEEFKKVLQSIHGSVDDLEQLIIYFHDEVASYLYLIDESLLNIWGNTDTLISNTDELESLLQKLLDEFTYTGTNVISQPDTSVLDGYYEAEGDLLDNLQLSAPLSVDINSNALAFCWDTVELFFLSHDKVLAAVLVVLSFGIMALALGR